MRGGGEIKMYVTFKIKTRFILWQNRAVQAARKLWKAANPVRVRCGKQEPGLLLQMCNTRIAQQAC